MYTLLMALRVTNEQVEKNVRALAGLAGESVTEAIGKAVAERIERLRGFKPSRPKPTVEEITALVRSYNLQPINSDLIDDEILGYGPDGYCE